MVRRGGSGHREAPTIVGAWFSWNSLADFGNNVRSIQNAYLGGYHKSGRGTGLDTFVASRDAALDARIKDEIQAALEAIDAIPRPFRNNLGAATEIEAAIGALATLAATLADDLVAAAVGS